MLINSGNTQNQYSEKQKQILIDNLKRKYKLVEVLDYGASMIIYNFQRNIRAHVFFDGLEITYEVHSLNAL